VNIWLLTSEYPPDYGGGIATYCYHTARMLTRRGHKVTVFTAIEDSSMNLNLDKPQENLQIVRFSPTQTPQSIALGTYARMAYDSAVVIANFILENGPPDVIESQEYLGLPYFLLQRRYLLDEVFQGIPIVITAHTPNWICQKYDKQLEYRFPGYWISEMERFSLIAADKIIYPSHRLFSEIDKELPQIKDRSLVIPNPYEDVSTKYSGKKFENRHGFLFTAKIERRKGIETLLETFEKLWNQGFSEPLYLMGNDWYDELNQQHLSEFINLKYKKFIEEKLLIWYGKQRPEVIREKLDQVKALVLPSLFENFPYAVLEAMASGCPVIVSSSGGHSEIVQDGINGFIFSHNVPGEFEHKIRILADLSHTKFTNLSLAARSRVTEVSGFDMIAPLKEQVFAESIDEIRSSKIFPFIRGKAKKIQDCKNNNNQEIKGLLSIVIPFYNLGDFIEDTLESLSKPIDFPIEIIIIDDGSTDEDSFNKLRMLQKKYSINLIQKENEGLSIARNTGAEFAKGEFLAFLDADDWIDVGFYREAIKILNYYENIHFVGCWAEYFGEVSSYWATWPPEPPYTLVHNTLNTSALVYRKDVFLSYGKNDPDMSFVMEDYDSLINLLENEIRGVSIPKPYFKYRVRNNSMYHAANENMKVFAYQKIASKHRKIFSEYAEGIINIINANGPGFLYDNPTIWYPVVNFSIDNPNKLGNKSNEDKKINYFIVKSYNFCITFLRKIKRKIIHLFH
jgi:glycosyltransferase involved in cell wall biosynthesis